MVLSPAKVNRFLQRTSNSRWHNRYESIELFLFLATLPPLKVSGNRVFVHITRAALGNHLHMSSQTLYRKLEMLQESRLVRREKGYDTTNIHVSFDKNRLYD